MKKFEKLALVMALAIALTFILVGCNGKSTSDATVNGSNISFLSSANKAADKASMELTGAENVMVIDLMKVDAKSVDITLHGKSSGKNYSASSNDVVGDVMTGLIGLVSDMGISHKEGSSFYINGNAFEEGEVVIVEVTFISSETALDEAFGKGTDTQYWAFIAKHSEDAPAKPESGDKPEGEESTDDPKEENKNSGDGIIDTILDGINGVTGDNSVDENGVPEVSKDPVGALLIEGFQLNTYSTQEVAQEKVQGLPSKLANNSTITGVPIDNTARIKVWVENGNGGMDLEILLSADNNWTSSMSLSHLSGQNITLGIVYESYGILPQMTFQYVTVQIP